MDIDSYIRYNVNMSRISEKKSEQILVNLEPSPYRRLLEVADTEDRPLGYVGRELMLRGLALYERDGKLRGEAPAAKSHSKIVGGIFPGRTVKDDLRKQYIETEDVEFMKPVRRKVKAKR